MPKTRGKLKPYDEYRLTENYSFIVREVDAQYLLPDLFSKFVIDAYDKEKILSKPTASERTQMLLDMLLNSGPGDAYSKFVKVLEKDYPDVAARLIATEVKETLQRCGRFSVCENSVTVQLYNVVRKLAFADTSIYQSILTVHHL